MTAYVDESLRQTTSGLYLVAAAVIIDERADNARHHVRKVLTGHQRRFHWNDAGEAQRAQMVEVVGALAPTLLAYACRPLPKRQDRARALCVGSLVWDLQQLDVSHVVFESRQARNDRKDADTIEQARRAQRAAPGLTYAFNRPQAEPLLWVADAVAGAVATHLADGNSGYVGLLPAGLLAIRDIRP